MRISWQPLAALVAITAIAGCRADGPQAVSDRIEPGQSPSAELETRTRIDALRQRFRIAHRAPRRLHDAPSIPEATWAPVIEAGIATFEAPAAERVRAVIPPEAMRGAPRTASVALPARANGMAELEDDTSHLSVHFRLEGASDIPVSVADGMALYSKALNGSDVVHRVTAEGTEDYAIFETRPDREELDYEVDVSRVAGLRLVANTLEFLDSDGAPRLRVAPPYAIDEGGARVKATIHVERCAFDVDPRAPWGRTPTPPGNQHCRIRVTWADVAYPAIIDPVWAATGSLTAARSQHTATLLPSGKVLIAGGYDGDVGMSSAELYDPTLGTFASTSPMTITRLGHTATLLSSGKVLLAAGGDVGVVYASAELYDPMLGTFTPTGSMSIPRTLHTATALPGGKVLMVAGDNYMGSISIAELYNPVSGTFSNTGSTTVPHFKQTATLLNTGKVLVAGGYVVVAELYDPATGKFTATGSLTVTRTEHSATLLGSGSVLVTGGIYDDSEGKTAEVYDPVAATFTQVGSMSSPRYYGHSATVIASGKVLIAGGFGFNIALSKAELYDPIAQTFADTTSMTGARYYHTATSLPSGKVLAAGGAVTFMDSLASAELFTVAATGGACTIGDDCSSGVCNDGVCCAGACSGICKTCKPGSGACVGVTGADDPDTCAGANTCDAAAACKLKTGQPCPAPSACVSGFCSDSICCNTSCNGGCDACAAALGASADGTCTIEPQGYAGNPQCGADLACDGTSAACPVSCVADIDCLPSDYCDANGACQPRKAQGVACNSMAGADCKGAGCRECSTGHCVDGVCCDSACDTTCQACAAALKESGADDGVCDSAKAQTNPHKDNCPVDAPSTCGHDGLCSGAGACSLYYPQGTSCGASMCIAGNKAAGEICDGSGACISNPMGTSCGTFLCVSGGCPLACASDADCEPTAYCKQQTCIPKAQSGAACSSGDECSSGSCADGVCCNTDCKGQCEACNVGNTKGTCTGVVGPPVAPRAACAAGDAQHPCAASQCNGKVTASCAGFAGASVACREAGCEGGVQTLAASCNGAGECPAIVTKVCAPYTCGSGICNTDCANDDECAPGNHCLQKKCISGATCGADGHTVLESDNTSKDCAPYRCAGGACGNTCASVDDCAAPNVCDATGHCVAAGGVDQGPGVDQSGGCALIATSDDSPSRIPAAIIALGLALVTARRKRSPARAVTGDR